MTTTPEGQEEQGWKGAPFPRPTVLEAVRRFWLDVAAGTNDLEVLEASCQALQAIKHELEAYEHLDSLLCPDKPQSPQVLRIRRVLSIYEGVIDRLGQAVEAWESVAGDVVGADPANLMQLPYRSIMHIAIGQQLRLLTLACQIQNRRVEVSRQLLETEGYMEVYFA